MKFFDGINHPSAAVVKADGLAGGMLYLGTPASGKDLTAAQYADYKAHGLLVAVGFEHLTTDWQGGAAAGKANAAAFLADAKAKHVSPDDPFWVAIDMHVAASDLPTVVAYVRAYVAAVRAGEWRGRAGGYGFPEVTTALHTAAVVDWYWGAGRRADQPSFVNIWQDNTQTIQVGGSADDEDWVLVPLPQETDMTSALTDQQASQLLGVWEATFDGSHDAAGTYPPIVHTLLALGTQLDALTKAVATVAADVAALKTAQAPAEVLTGQATVTVALNPAAAP